MNDLISIIVPVYNTELYIEECINSVLNQTYTNFELILIDDGSKDKSPEICDKYAEKDNRIKVIHQDNQGLSGARNSGIYISQGQYITFLDSDDLLDCDFLKRMYEVSLKYSANIVQCGALFGEERILLGQKNLVETTFLGKKALLNHNVKTRICGNLYKKEIFDNILFPKDIRLYEDEAISYKLIYNCNIFVRIEDELYYYYFNKNSISKIEPDCIDDTFINIFQDRIKYFTDINDTAMIVRSKERLCRSLIVLYIRCRKNPNNTNDRNKYFKMIRKLTKEILFSNVVSNKSKLQCILLCIFPNIVTKYSIKLKLNSRF